MDFLGKALPLHDGDVRTIAGYLGCEVAAVRALLAVEAAGKGFDSSGRPKMLFEPHIFWRELGEGKRRDQAQKADLAYRSQGTQAYPKDSYPRLAAALAIDETAALRSASWGLGQVMGFNHRAAGFATVQELVSALSYSEGAQLYAMARFIVSNALQPHLRRRDWPKFAAGYNGKNYAVNRYDTKLAGAYSQRPASEKVVPPPATEAELNAVIGKVPVVIETPTPRPASPEPIAVVPLPELAPIPQPKPVAVPQPASSFWAALARILSNLLKKA